MNPRILIADDHELVRSGVARVIQAAHPEWEIVASVDSGEQAVTQGKLLRPDVAVLDLSMPGLSGLSAAEQLIDAIPGIHILVLTMHSAAPIRRQLEKAGVQAYLAKNEAPKRIVPVVERMLAGEPFFASESASRVPSEMQLPEYIPVQYLLTARELDVLKLLAQGRSNKELAAELEMSVRTAESHRASILAKLHVESLGDLVRIAVRDNVV
jgi:DNA-binding NarL/FixJ family response regulator